MISALTSGVTRGGKNKKLIQKGKSRFASIVDKIRENR